ncbi:PREDICTED: otoferlin-like [Dufourea novaeangliae]|uniref:otoferlin-like n=1 Tax=Dufourea novaeangliae TaxID=178035 RepID=UPI000766FAF5|nr:PREDICTED: otoferlin-like [Dufourea novaeangliae]
MASQVKFIEYRFYRVAMGPRKFRPTTYQVCVTIVEARHLPQNANPLVVVKVGNRKRKTVVREKTDTPFYNEYFVFDLFCDMEELLGTKIIIAVYIKHYLRLKFHGSASFEIALVWEQPDRQYYHKWAMLTNPKDLGSGPKGYVKCNIAINVKGEKMKGHPETEGEDDIEGNLLLPVGGESLPFRQHARYIFTIYRADGLPDMSSMCYKSDFENINPYVQISFAGMKGTTSEAWQTYGPRFNEKITFKEMFPSLCQRMRIAIKHRLNSYQTCVVASHILDLSKISHSGEYGFLPTFGPSFLHFYGSSSTERNSCFGKCLTALPLYRGRVLLSLKTEMEDPETSSRIGAETEPTAPIIENRLWRTEQYCLVAVLYDVSMIDRRKFWTKSISFEVSLGNAGNRQFPYSQCFEDNNNDGNRMPERRPDFESGTVPRLTGSLDGKYNYLPLGSRKPCMYVKSWWPNLEWRMLNSNRLGRIADFLERKLEELEGLVALEDPQAYKLYNETIRSLKEYCFRYLHTLDAGLYDDRGGTTRLDRHRVNLCRKEIENLLRRIKINGELPSNRYTRIAMVHAYQYLRNVKKLRADPQHSLPDVFIWMIAGSRRVACSRLPAEELIYSEDPIQRGRMCGRKVDILMRNPRDHEDDEVDYAASKIEIFLWLGNMEYIGACWSAIPPGYEVEHETSVDTFPKYVQYTRSTVFQLRAHIFQGRFDPGMDASGLLDPLVRVAFHGYTATTRVIEQTLDPFWDQTLILPPRTVHGTKENIKNHPPKVTMEVFDQDICGIKEFCGRFTAVPLVKLAAETYSPPDFPPKLEWYTFKSQRDCTGSVLAAFELIEVNKVGEDETTDKPISGSRQDITYNIPDDIRPKMASYRLEVIFWGVRDMKKMNYVPVLKPRIIIECAGVDVKSEVMENAKKFGNFEEPHIVVDLDMPELDVYYPSVTIKAFDSRGFGCFKYAGICIIPSVKIFLEQLITEEDYNAQIHDTKLKPLWTKKQFTILPLPIDYDPSRDENKGLISYKKMARKDSSSWIRKILRSVKRMFASLLGGEKTRKRRMMERRKMEDESLDWWSKYFASLEAERSRELGSSVPDTRRLAATFRIYDGELEMQPQFAGFQDRLRTFELWKGRRAADPDYDSDHYVGKFKGRISVYRWPHPRNLPCKTRNGRSALHGICNDYPSPEPVKLLVRLYVVKGINLQPNDPLSGKSDPYLCVRLGKTFINDKKNYIANQLNPTFGRLFEIEATLPNDYLLTIQVWDYDAMSTDDLIGETKIDLENRFYTRHRATCGISETYHTDGYNMWRDREKPSWILDHLCKKNNLPLPEYRVDHVRIGRKRFPFVVDGQQTDETDREECMALNVLHQWHDFPVCGFALVPEHVERRPLFNAAKPGLEQGKLDLWIDMFQFEEIPPKPAVDISPPVPREYEIRVIVWNTEDVPLVDSQFLTGEKCSDIYVKGWIVYDDHQKTDIHYNSLTGEGNFNWRFIFRVTYSKGERVMFVRRKVSALARSETEEKLPCKLQLQVWDSDHFSPDDFLGALAIDLSRMPRGSPNSKNCTLHLLDQKLPTMDLFKVTRIRAWWPFQRSVETGSYVQAGKVELEMSIFQAGEADEQPAGKGRDPPQELPPPNRPDTSFSWFRNPWKAFRYVVCRYYKWRILCCFLILLFILLLACGIYAFPGYLVKRIIGA